MNRNLFSPLFSWRIARLALFNKSEKR